MSDSPLKVGMSLYNDPNTSTKQIFIDILFLTKKHKTKWNFKISLRNFVKIKLCFNKILNPLIWQNITKQVLKGKKLPQHFC